MYFIGRVYTLNPRMSAKCSRSLNLLEKTIFLFLLLIWRSGNDGIIDSSIGVADSSTIVDIMSFLFLKKETQDDVDLADTGVNSENFPEVPPTEATDF